MKPGSVTVGRVDYEERRNARLARLRARAASLSSEASSRINAAQALGSHIPLGQPVIVGHHSERKMRSLYAKIDNGYRKGFETLGKAEDARRRADAAEASRAISSDDPTALDRLREKAVAIAADVAFAKRVNALHRKGGIAAFAVLTDDERFRAMGALDVQNRAGMYDVPFPGYYLTNRGAELRRIAKRIEAMEKQASRPTPEAEQVGTVEIREQDNRVQLVFPGKPSDAIRTALKVSGFRWARSEGAWQRMASDAAWQAARRIAGEVQS